jgi:hypothetical protein
VTKHELARPLHPLVGRLGLVAGRGDPRHLRSTHGIPVQREAAGARNLPNRDVGATNVFHPKVRKGREGLQRPFSRPHHHPVFDQVSSLSFFASFAYFAVKPFRPVRTAA